MVAGNQYPFAIFEPMIRFVLISILSFLGIALMGQTDTAHIYTFGGEGDEQGYDIEPTKDGGYLMVGSTSSYGQGNSDVYLVKVDSNINYQWSRAIGKFHLEVGYAVKQTSNGGYIICGYSNSGGNGTYDGYLVKTNDSGIVVWQKFYGGLDWDKFYDLEITPDGGFMIVGETHSNGAGNADAWVVKTDINGTVQWEKYFGGKNKDVAHDLIPTNDNFYAFCGENASKNDTSNADAWLVKFDETGKIILDQTYGGLKDDVVYGLTQLADSGYAMIGKTLNKSDTIWDTYMLSTDFKGNFSQNQWWGGVGKSNDRGNAILQRTDNKVVFVGHTSAAGSGGKDADLGVGNYPSLTFFNGTTWGREKDDDAQDLILLNDSLFLIFGTGASLQENYYSDFQLIISEAPAGYKVFTHLQDASLPKPSNVENISLNESMSISIIPNPTKSGSIITIDGLNSSEETFYCKIFNTNSQLIQSLKLSDVDNQFELDSSIPVGLYVLVVNDQYSVKFLIVE